MIASFSPWLQTKVGLASINGGSPIAAGGEEALWSCLMANKDNLQQTKQQQQQQHQLLYGTMQSSASSSSMPAPGNFISKEAAAGAYDLGELDQALFLYLEGQDHPSVQEQRRSRESCWDSSKKFLRCMLMREACITDILHEFLTYSSTDEWYQVITVFRRTAFMYAESSGVRPTLNIFPSEPMHVEPSTKDGISFAAPISNTSKRPSEPSMELASQRNGPASVSDPGKGVKVGVKREGNRKGPTSSSEQEGPKTPDPKTLRRLAQNREAARKSRLRKKAYVQQLESSRIRLAQLEQELQRARAQGFFMGGGIVGEQGVPVAASNISSDAAVFDLEYTRWLEEHHRLMCELRAAVQEHLPENELRLFVDNCLTHYDQVMNLKSMIVKSDVFHVVSGMWKTPAERCFMWMGGFRPSELIKILLNHVEPLTEQQILGICSLQQSTQEAEEALSQGLEALHQSLSDTIASDALSFPSNMANYMGQMAVAMNKLTTLEGFVRQADNLRHQMLHRLHQILTTRQAARCFLAIGEYFHRLRALSSLWLARPRQE